jgi:hypothetical protein
MSILGQLERDLQDAAARLVAGTENNHAASSSSFRTDTPRRRRWRLALIAVCVLLASTTIALAASGVILSGSPVKPEGPLNPGVGEGIPKPGSARLLELRVADPDGGPPWGMRVVATTRGLICLQVGRVENGELGELGIEGAFHNDGRFHPLPADVLPQDATSGIAANESCHLAGQEFAGELGGIDRSAAGSEQVRTQPRRDLREISYGQLGQQAVSVTYHVEGGQRTSPVAPGIGAYLIVQRMPATGQVGVSGGGGGVDGRRPNPAGAAISFSYRINGKICQDTLAEHVSNRCPAQPIPTAALAPLIPKRSLHRRLYIQLHFRHRLVTSGELQFTAPFAVTSAKQDYLIAIPIGACHGSAISEASLDRNVAAGSIVRRHLEGLYDSSCGQRSMTVIVIYDRIGEPSRDVVVGKATVTAPPGTVPKEVPPDRRIR